LTHPVRERYGLATEGLPVRVLHPGVDHGFIGGIEGVLQVQSPAAKRDGKAGRPRPDVKEAARVRSISAQSISAASLTSG